VQCDLVSERGVAVTVLVFEVAVVHVFEFSTDWQVAAHPVVTGCSTESHAGVGLELAAGSSRSGAVNRCGFSGIKERTASFDRTVESTVFRECQA